MLVKESSQIKLMLVINLNLYFIYKITHKFAILHKNKHQFTNLEEPLNNIRQFR